MLEYGEAILVGPVMHYFGEHENRDVFLPCRLWCKEVVTFLRTQIVSFVPIPGGRIRKVMNLGFARGLIQMHRACSSSSTVVTDVLCQGMLYLGM